MVRKERLQWEFGVEVLPKIDMQVRDYVNAEDPKEGVLVSQVGYDGYADQ